MKPQIAIFFDTNVIEARLTKKPLLLYNHKNFLMSSDLEKWLSLKNNYRSSLDIEYYIADITRQELRQHYVESYDALCHHTMEMEENISQLGYHPMVEHKVQCINSKEYAKWFDSEFEKFLENHQIKLDDEISDLDLFKQLVSMSVGCEFPFRKKSNEGRDVGFKDALLYLSVKKMVEKFSKCILITKDQDFKKKSEEKSSILVYNTIEEFETDLSNDNLLTVEDKLNALLKSPYNLEQILHDIDMHKDECKASKILKVEENEDDSYTVDLLIETERSPKTIKLEVDIVSKDISIIEQ